MKPILLLLSLLFLSCSHHLTQTQINNDAPVAGTFDTLAAYRKAPGSPKDIKVKSYVKKDSTVVKGYYRSGKNTH